MDSENASQVSSSNSKVPSALEGKECFVLILNGRRCDVDEFESAGESVKIMLC